MYNMPYVTGQSDNGNNERHCAVCNGYYGPCFEQPVCGTCHAFLYANDLDAEVAQQMMQMSSNVNDLSDNEQGESQDDSDRDSGNEEEPQTDHELQQDQLQQADEAQDVPEVLEELNEVEVDGAIGGNLDEEEQEDQEEAQGGNVNQEDALSYDEQFLQGNYRVSQSPLTLKHPVEEYAVNVYTYTGCLKISEQYKHKFSLSNNLWTPCISLHQFHTILHNVHMISTYRVSQTYWSKQKNYLLS